MQEIEIEFNNLLTKEEFDRLLDHLPFPSNAKKQTNYYFETKDYALREKQCALRIREKGGLFQLTLKEPHPDGMLETHDELTKEEAESWIQGEIIPKQHTTKQLEAMNISPENLLYYGNLTTERREAEYKNVLIVLDYSTYNKEEDYEFELEANDVATGQTTFQSILSEHNIQKRHTPTKIERFFNSRK